MKYSEILQIIEARVGDGGVCVCEGGVGGGVMLLTALPDNHDRHYQCIHA